MPTVSTILKIFQFRKKKTCSPKSSSFQIMSTFENLTKNCGRELEKKSLRPKKHSVFYIFDSITANRQKLIKDTPFNIC